MMPVEAGNNSLKELFSIPQATSYVAETGFSKFGAPAVPVYAFGGKNASLVSGNKLLLKIVHVNRTLSMNNTNE